MIPEFCSRKPDEEGSLEDEREKRFRELLGEEAYWALIAVVNPVADVELSRRMQEIIQRRIDDVQGGREDLLGSEHI